MSQTRPVAPSASELAALDEVYEPARPVMSATERLRTVVGGSYHDDV
jgi:hypothetical protein